MRRNLKQCLINKLGIWFVLLKWKFFGFYYTGLAIQAQYLYRQSILYKLRWQQLGLDFAEESFKGWETHFFNLAKKQPLRIRAQIFYDGLMGKEHIAYYINKE